MFDLINLRKRHGFQAIADVPHATVMGTHRGFPVISQTHDPTDWDMIIDRCPTNAITKNPVSIDLGKCTFCGECERLSGGAIHFTSEARTASDRRDALVVKAGTSHSDFASAAIEARKTIHGLFGRSLKFRQVSAGGCNGCEMELAACGNVNFDMGRYGIDFVASPRHADGIVITGPITKNMAPALMDAYSSVAEPRLVIAVGACAISGGIFAGSPELNREFLDSVKVDLFIPGCPPHPLTIIQALLDFLGKK